jgi:hypothetical protein
LEEGAASTDVCLTKNINHTSYISLMVNLEPIIFNRKPKVSSIYDTFSFKGYRNIPVFFLFKYDVGLMEWAIKNIEGFCIQEYDFLVNSCTVNKKVFEMSHIQSETMENYNYYEEFMSDDEMMAAFGSHKYFLKRDVSLANDKKLISYGIVKTPPKMMERTYLCYNRSSFPSISGKWVYEKIQRSAKNTADIIYFRAVDEKTGYASEFINQRIALFDFNGFFNLLVENGETIMSTSLQEGGLFEATTNLTSDTRYTFRKIR